MAIGSQRGAVGRIGRRGRDRRGLRATSAWNGERGEDGQPGASKTDAGSPDVVRVRTSPVLAMEIAISNGAQASLHRSAIGSALLGERHGEDAISD